MLTHALGELTLSLDRTIGVDTRNVAIFLVRITGRGPSTIWRR
jgi:hypothetical protein